ncbi:tripartite-type tricarboxylate transporter receptor subunit TctC [Salsuginibacillus halophilus]|uniref:Tripartite-type tricarboxylate transporter receptor subunit TctC n=1 Tax=Salsuginibacillus halophilus TaxID=517424 RepID=A0A2P8HQN8_9BACI|nr:tripartite tricarboxylate transporter substrate binding protein [Salsuginibacillus halophilus]PSL48536.1 tripartite-type tricarboxylate transporter receptor subunit TctC [Salsuginibacillus halophilus]
MKKFLRTTTALGLAAVVAAGCGDEAADEQTEGETDDAGDAEETDEGVDDVDDEDDEAEEDGSSYPEQDIDIIVPYSAGGGGDTVARILTDHLGDELDASFNVINQEGAGGEVGIQAMADADPDGYTLGVFGYPDNVVLENTVDTDFEYDSFEYLGAFDDVPHSLFVGPDSDFEDPDELVEYAEENPGEITVGESGALGLLKVLAFNDEADIEMSPINYDGGGELVNDLLGGHIDVASTSITSYDEITAEGGEPLGYAAEERIDMFDDVPTFEEQGYDLDLGVSRVLVAPDGIPEEVEAELSEALDAIGESEELQQAFEDANLPYRYLDNDEVDDVLEDRNENLQPIIEENADDF